MNNSFVINGMVGGFTVGARGSEKNAGTNRVIKK
jgi:hypothetical protein